MSESWYEPNDNPTSAEKARMWAAIEDEIPTSAPARVYRLDWKSFWIGNAAAVLILFALIGVYTTVTALSTPDQPDEQMYSALNTATDNLKQITPILIDQAGERNRSSIESTVNAIAEIDQLIDELKTDILIYGDTPAKQINLRRLYATKLEFYQDLLINDEDQS